MRRSVHDSLRRNASASLLAGIAGLSAASFAGTALAVPLIRTAPLLVVALAPRLPFVMAAGSKAGLVPAFAVSLPRLLAADPLYFRLGQQHATRVPEWLRCRSRLQLLALLALWPNGKVVAAAAATGVSERRAAVLKITGTAAKLLVCCLAGRAS